MGVTFLSIYLLSGIYIRHTVKLNDIVRRLKAKRLRVCKLTVDQSHNSVYGL